MPLRKNAAGLTNRKAMDHRLLLDLHRELRHDVGYRGRVPNSNRIADSLCALRAASDETGASRLFAVEKAVAALILLIAIPVAVWNLLRAYWGAEASVVELPGRPPVRLTGRSMSAWSLVVGLLLVAFASELLLLAFWGSIESKTRLRKRFNYLYKEALAAKLPSAKSCSKGASPAEYDEGVSGEGSDPAAAAAAAAGEAGEGAAAVADPEGSARALRLGLMRTDTGQVSAGIDRAMGALRRLVGAATVREPDDTDVEAVISEVLVPEMLEARRRMTVGSPGYGEPAETCSQECAGTAADVLASFEAGNDVSAERLERAWADCPDSMRDMCGQLKRSQDRCAAMCNSTKHQVRRFHTVLGHMPGEDWELHGGAKSETQCWKACGDDYDAAMFVREDGPKGRAQCFLHAADSTYDEFREVPGAAGAALIKDGSPMVLPGNDPAHVAEAIVESIKARSLTVDLSASRDAVFAELKRQAPTSYEQDIAWFQDCVSAVTAMLSAADQSSGRVPNAGHFNRVLQRMTAQDFQNRVTWPVLSATVFMDVRSRSAAGGDGVVLFEFLQRRSIYSAVFWTGAALACAGLASWIHRQIRTESVEGDAFDAPWREKMGWKKTPLGMRGPKAAAMSVANVAGKAGDMAVGAAAAATGASRDSRSNPLSAVNPLAPGRLRSRKLWAVLDTNVTLIALFSLVMTMAATQFVYWMRKEQVNSDKRRDNTENLLMRVCALNSQLLDFSSSLPEVSGAGSEGCWSELKWEDDPKLTDLRARVFSGDSTVLRPFPEDRRSTPVFHVLTVKQRNDLLARCIKVLEAYDLCNDAAADASVPFPLSDVIVYGILCIGAVVVVANMYAQIGGGELFEGASRIKRALEAAKLNRPGAVALLRSELARGSVYFNAAKIAGGVAKYVFAAVTVAVIVMLARDSASGLDRLSEGSECGQ